MVIRIKKNGEFIGKSMVTLYKGLSGKTYSNRKYGIIKYCRKEYIRDKETLRVIEPLKEVLR